MATYNKLQVFTQTDDFEKAVKLVSLPLEQPEPDQVRVRNIYVGLNATDLITITGRAFAKNYNLPYNVGYEALGVVDALGSAIPTGQLSIGQPVLYNPLAKGFVAGAFSEYSYNSLNELIPVPDIKPDYLSTVINGLTASMALDKCGQLKAGEKVLITAAAGGTGQIALQWAKLQGCYVIGTVSTEEKEKLLYDLGADFVINYRKQNLDQVLSEQFPDGIDVIWETIGGETFKVLMRHLAVGGRMIIIGTITSYKEKDNVQFIGDINISSQQLMFGKNSIIGFALPGYNDYDHYSKKLIAAVADGTIKAQVDQGECSPDGTFFGLQQISRAHDWLYAGKNVGKVVVQIQKI